MPLPWKALAVVASGAALGLGVWMLGSEYASGRSEACLSCHLMGPAHASWRASAHRTISCAECHLPTAGRSLAKAWVGLQHATVFALHREPGTLRLQDVAVVDSNCRRCHGPSRRMHPVSEALCGSCHRDTPHGHPLALLSPRLQP